MLEFVPEPHSGKIAAYHLFWDAYNFSSPHSGVVQHCLQLAGEFGLLGLAPIFLTSRPVDFFKDSSFPLVSLNPSIHPVFSRVKFISASLAYQACVAQIEKQGKGGAVFFHGFSNINLPLFGTKRKIDRFIVTVHDIIPLLAPQEVSRSYAWQFRFSLPMVLKKADKIVCVSDWTRSTLQERFPSFVDKMIVIPNGYHPSERSRLRLNLLNEEDRSLGAKHCELLSVSRWEKYKRFDDLLMILKKNQDLYLQMVTDYSGLLYLQEKGRVFIEEKRLKIATNISRQELLLFYKRADIYLHTSLLEGFCLPAAEALMADRPVVYRRGSALDDFVGSCGIGVPEEATTEDWLLAIEQARLLAKEASFPQKLQERMEKQATWKSSALNLKTIYDTMASGL
ncbi:MAG: glycosyltransferase [Oligoflexales bacterium]|nr:glycosyltransferase [Oligoflexales bacterium]